MAGRGGDSLAQKNMALADAEREEEPLQPFILLKNSSHPKCHVIHRRSHSEPSHHHSELL